MSKLDGHAETLATWLKADQHRGKRDRRTVKAMYEALAEQGYVGGYGRMAAFALRWHTAAPGTVEQALTLHWTVQDADDHAVVFTDVRQEKQWREANIGRANFACCPMPKTLQIGLAWTPTQVNQLNRRQGLDLPTRKCRINLNFAHKVVKPEPAF